MAKNDYKYFPVIQNPEKATFNRSFVYVNKREWTSPSGKFQPAICKSISPGSNGIYVVDVREQAEYKKEKLALMQRKVEGGIYPIIGPFDTVEEAVIAERKVRPLTDKEKIKAAYAVLAENEVLRAKNAKLEANQSEDFGPPKSNKK